MSPWVWVVAVGLVPASIGVMWALSHVLPRLDISQQTFDWWARTGMYLVPTVAAVVSAMLLLYGAQQVT